MSVAWTVENPIDGMNVDIVPDYPEWLNRFDVSVEGKISFNVDEYTGQETREAVVAVNYGEDSSSFRVVQAGMEEPDGEEAIKLEIIEARPNTVIVSIETRNLYGISMPGRKMYSHMIWNSFSGMPMDGASAWRHG